MQEVFVDFKTTHFTTQMQNALNNPRTKTQDNQEESLPQYKAVKNFSDQKIEIRGGFRNKMHRENKWRENSFCFFSNFFPTMFRKCKI